MQIPSFTRSHLTHTPAAAPSTSAASAAPDPTDAVIHTKGMPAFTKPLPHIADARDLMGMPVPKLQRPVILVHGLAQHADTFLNLKNFLTNEPSNGFGGVYSKAHEDEFLLNLKEHSDAKVFALDLSDNLASPADVACELRRMAGLIQGFTGAKQVDVVTHSMGALVAREAMHEGKLDLDHLIMVAPPNQGAYDANMACLLEHVYHRYPQDKMGAMQALRVEYSARGKVANAWLHELNQAWPQDSQGVDATIITGVGIPTTDRSWTMTNPGDGMVAAHRAVLDDTPIFLAEPNELPPGDPNYRDFQQLFYNHLQIASAPEMYAKVGEILTSDPPPPPPPEPQEPCFWDVDPSILPEPIEREPVQHSLFEFEIPGFAPER